MNTPVALFIFRRPDTTERVFARIAEARPSRLLVIADGPRTPEEQSVCDQTRAIVTNVDWPCEVATNFASTNLGLRQRMASGISWVFEQAEEAIILEDDCLPHPTFFRFCAELLDRYRDERRIMHISGDCFVNNPSPTYSYYFTRYAHVWGWATWRRAWTQYDATLEGWTDRRTRSRILRELSSSAERRFWNSILDEVRRGEIDTWDYQWAFTLLSANAWGINPTVNLVHNIGFGGSATHTLNADSKLANLSAGEMNFPLAHPETEERASDLDKVTAQMFFTKECTLRRRARTNYRRLQRPFLNLQRRSGGNQVR